MDNILEKIEKLKTNILESSLNIDELELINEKIDDINDLFNNKLECAVDNMKYRNKLLQLIAPVIIYCSINYPDYESLNNISPNYENQTPNGVGG